LVALALGAGIASAITVAAPAILHAAETLSGAATVIDGDTIDIAGTRVRLEGIDAPEAGQTCGGKWFGTWDCGTAARNALQKLVARERVDCENAGHDKYGRMLGLCSVGGRDINAEMVREGLAWAFVKYSTTYVEAEAEARTRKAGIWQGEAEPAWVYREKRWAHAENEAPEGCAIKGNVTDRGHIYHMPWSPWYTKVRVDPARGERWFCSEREALAAGWRPAAVN
jgi:endonuclease YncB( thermonuclease family)